MPSIERATGAATILSLLFLTACGSDAVTPKKPDPGGPEPASVAVHAGNQQEAEAGAKVPVAPAVIVRDAQGQPLSGVAVQFTVNAGGGQIAGANPTTNASGIATVTSWTLGTSGAQSLSAKVGSLPAVTFTATISEDVGATTDFAAGAGGGTLTISDPEHPYFGLKMTVVPGTLSGNATWQFRVDEQASPGSLPAGFRLAGPPIEITTNQARGSKLMTIEVPVTTAPGELAFVALRDPSRNVAELLPVIDRTENSVVVATTHLRADLLPGPIVAAGLRHGSSRNTTGWMMPVATPLPTEILGNLPSFSGNLNRWSVVDFGSALFPNGHSLAIAVMQALGTTPTYPRFNQMLKGLDKPGLYAEAAPLAALQIAMRDVTASLSSVAGQLAQALGVHDKADRDALVLQNVVAGVRYTGRAALVAGVAEGAGGQAMIAAAAVSGVAQSVSLVNPAQTEPISLSISAGGINDVAMAQVAGAPLQTVRDLVPISPVFIATEVANTALIGMEAVHRASGTVRETLNQQMARAAGQPEIEIEIQAFHSEPWRKLNLSEGITRTIRSHNARVRVNTALATIHRVGGSLVSQYDGSPVEALEGLDLESEPASTPVPRTISLYSTIGDAVRQLTVATVSVARALFTVTPGEVEIEAGKQEVEFTASVPMPPAAGYIIQWAWGDDDTTEVTNATSAKHEYEEAQDYTVVATLLDAGSRERLAIDTVKVRGGAVAWEGWASMSMTNFNPQHAHTLRAEANNIRFELAMSEGGSQHYQAVSGVLSVWNEVPCASYISPVVSAVVSNYSEYQWINIATTDPNASPGSNPATGVWFNANGYAGGLQVMNKSCPTDQNPDPQAYVFATGAVWLKTYSNAVPWRKATNPDVLEGSYSQTDGTVTTVWTWRFERVSAGQ